MSARVPHCPHCGARPRASGPYCEFCGNLLPVEAPAEAQPLALSVERRFERLENHASFAELLSKRPSAAGPIASSAVSMFFCVAISVGAGSMLFAFRPEGMFMIVPLLALGIGVVGFFSALVKGANLATSELIARPAIVAGERTRVSGGGNGSSSTHYFITLESKDGERTEFPASDKLAGRVAEGDIGVAYIKADELIDFERVRV